MKRLESNLNIHKASRKPIPINRVKTPSKTRSKSKNKSTSKKSNGSDRGSLISNSSKLSRKSNSSIRSKGKTNHIRVKNDDYQPRRHNLSSSGVNGLIKRRSKSRVKERSKSRDSEKSRSISKGK